MSSASSDTTVLGASAILVLLFKEPGAEIVRPHLNAGVINAANLAEVLAKRSDHGLPIQEAARAIAIPGLDVAPMTDKQPQCSAAMRASTPAARLSLGVAVRVIR